MNAAGVYGKKTFNFYMTQSSYLVELGVGSAGQETVELDQEAQVDILAFRLRSAGLPHVLVTDVDSHLDSKLVLITTF